MNVAQILNAHLPAANAQVHRTADSFRTQATRSKLIDCRRQLSGDR
jgi:hypothetical protein